MPIIHTAHLFEPLHHELVLLLRSLDDAQWQAPTVAGEWRVRDIVAHLLQGDLGRLSAQRDAHTIRPSRPIESYADLLALINDSNREAVAAMQRYSPRVLLELIEHSGQALSRFIQALDPLGPALYGVAWAGEDVSLNWMDIGREYTERWHHQQQIRDAVGAPLLLERRWAEPLFALSVLALPRAYDGLEAKVGTTIAIRIENGGEWSLTRGVQGWEVTNGAGRTPVADIRVSADAAWRIFYNAVSPEASFERLTFTGDPIFAHALARTRSVMV